MRYRDILSRVAAADNARKRSAARRSPEEQEWLSVMYRNYERDRELLDLRRAEIEIEAEEAEIALSNAQARKADAEALWRSQGEIIKD